MKIERYRHPFIFYGIAVLVPWALWFICAGISHSGLWDSPAWVTFGSFLSLLGLLAPMIIAFILILPDKEMRDELISSFTNFKDVKLKWWAFT
ncbi:MAG: hypothetical protein LBB89_09750, partial [Treponema sp.]|nr:hypothetical protein [Treponema sp.]